MKQRNFPWLCKFTGRYFLDFTSQNDHNLNKVWVVPPFQKYMWEIRVSRHPLLKISQNILILMVTLSLLERGDNPINNFESSSINASRYTKVAPKNKLYEVLKQTIFVDSVVHSIRMFPKIVVPRNHPF